MLKFHQNDLVYICEKLFWNSVFKFKFSFCERFKIACCILIKRFQSSNFREVDVYAKCADSVVHS